MLLMQHYSLGGKLNLLNTLPLPLIRKRDASTVIDSIGEIDNGIYVIFS